MQLPFPSLRSNLIAAFAAVIGISLLLASGAFAYLLRDYQVERERDRLAVMALAYSATVSRMAAGGTPIAAIGGQLDQTATETSIRMLLLDPSGAVLHDTDSNELVGRVLELPPPGSRRSGYQAVSTRLGNEIVITSGTPTGRFPPFRVGVVAPEQSLTTTWWEVLPRLYIAALSALLVSIAIAWWLASTITRPIAEITRASEEIAGGNYDPVLSLPETTDEVGRLTKAFTTMAREVARSHRTMRDLLANVSHDLRTPLTSISGFAGALVDGTAMGPEAAREAGRIIGEEAERMRRLVEDLLYLGRIESGDLALQRDPLDLADLARAAQSRFSFRAQESGIAFSVHAPDPVHVAGDAYRLGQVLDNLVENAFKHTPPTGRVDVHVSLEPVRPGGRGSRQAASAVLTVHNTDSYIPPLEADRVFERFYQVDKARADNRGRGLGLAIAREIVQAHGGRITLESSPAGGTSFTVRIPALETSASSPLLSTEPARPAEVGATHR